MNPQEPWYKKKKFIIPLVIVLLAIIGQFTNSSDKVESESVAEAQYLTVYRIVPNVFYDDEDNAWYWGAMFRTDEAPMTKLNCKVDALDKSGNTILSEGHQYNVVNDSTVIRYGEDNLPTTTKEIAKAIDSFNIYCAKPKG
jgi:hypothetical protein